MERGFILIARVGSESYQGGEHELARDASNLNQGPVKNGQTIKYMEISQKDRADVKVDILWNLAAVLVTF